VFVFRDGVYEVRPVGSHYYKADLVADLRTDPAYQALYLAAAQKDSREALLVALRDLAEARMGTPKLEEFGFRRDPPWILRRLYGLDHEDAAPFGTIFHMYLNCAQSEGRPENCVSQADVESEEDRKNQMLKILDEEIKRLEELRELSLALCFERIEFNKLTHLVPPPAVSERLLRYETHLSREFDRTLSQLERLQRMRLGLPIVPPINLRLSR
jgi:hypothetical protein